MNTTEFKACLWRSIYDSSSNPYKESVEMILKICRSKKHKDPIGDIECECNRAKRLISEREADQKTEVPVMGSAKCFGIGDFLAAADNVTERVAQLLAHRPCGNQESDPQNGKLAGYCVVCQVPWPCEIAKPKGANP